MFRSDIELFGDTILVYADVVFRLDCYCSLRTHLPASSSCVVLLPCFFFFLYILVEIGIPLALNKIPAFRIQVLRHLVLGSAAPSVYILGYMLPIQCGGSYWVVGPQW